MNPYQKGPYLTLDSCKLHRDVKGWKLQGDDLKKQDLEGKWDGVGEIDMNILLKGVPQLGDHLVALRRLTEAMKTPRRQICAGRQAVAYLMGDDIGIGFGSVLWGQRILASESGEVCPLYQGRLSNFQEGDNLTTRIEHSVVSGDLHDVKFSVFTDSMVFDIVYHKGKPKSPLLFDIFLQLPQVKMKGGLILHVIYIVGKSMIEADIDGIARGNSLVLVMRVVNSLKFVLVDEGAVEISPGLEGWIRSWCVDNLNKMRPSDLFEVL